MQSQTYGQEIDMWSVGCTLAEMFLCEPLWKGKDAKNQIDLILQTLGAPMPEEVHATSIGAIYYYTPLPIDWTNAQQATSNKKQATSNKHFTTRILAKKILRASKATGKVARLLAHAWPLHNPDATAKPLYRPLLRATQVGGGGLEMVKNGPKRAQIGRPRRHTALWRASTPLG